MNKFIIFGLLMLGSLVYFMILFNYELKPKFFIEDGISPDKLINYRPDIQNSTYLGEESAQITITAYHGFNCPSCRPYKDRLFNHLMDEYIKTGRVKYFYRPLIYPQDVIDNTMTYNYSVFTYCLELENKEEYWEIYSNMFYSDYHDYLTNNIITCMGESHTKLISVAEENDFFGINTQPTLIIGINGRDNTIISGMPSEPRLSRIIREKEVTLGK